MIDLKKDDFEIYLYAERYSHLIPKVSRQLKNRMEYEPKVLCEDSKDKSKPEWMMSLPQRVTDHEVLDKCKGALMGLAVGDAVGTTLEFMPRDRASVHDMIGKGPFNLKPGEWTDDTSMALCLAETYLESRKCDTDTFRDKLISWYKKGTNSSSGTCFDIGNTTRFALEQTMINGSCWFGNTSPDTAGNAALIRHTPTAIFRRKSLIDGWRDAAIQSRATHGAAESIDSCRFFNIILHYLLNGYGKDESFSPHVMSTSLRVLIINAGEYKLKHREQIRSSGYVIDTLEAAMWAVWHTNSFKDAVLLAANLADDADSVAATAGQLAGALYGLSGIPDEWINKIAFKDKILSHAEALYSMAPDEVD